MKKRPSTMIARQRIAMPTAISTNPMTNGGEGSSADLDGVRLRELDAADQPADQRQEHDRENPASASLPVCRPMRLQNLRNCTVYSPRANRPGTQKAISAPLWR